jgi:pentatricopeptide repeat protein
MQQVQSSAAAQAVSTVFETVGTEIVLFGLFCAGFLLFRLSAVQKLLNEYKKGASLKGKYAAAPMKGAFDIDPPSFPAKEQEDDCKKEDVRDKMSSDATAAKSAEKSAAHAHAVRVRSAVQRKNPNEAVQMLLAMQSSGHAVPAACVISVVRLLRECTPDKDIFEDLPTEILSPDAIAALLDHAVRAGDSVLLRRVHQHALAEHVQLSTASREVLLRGYSALGDSRAVEVFDELIEGGFEPSESALIAVVSLCAESRHVQMAEHAVKYSREVNGSLTLPLYSALMKVYGSAHLYHKICDLYDDMKRDGVVPDTVIYGSLIKSAVEGGRLELARQLFRESGNPDLLNYMSLIRAAGRERDVQKALTLLDELEQSPMAIDNTAYNCVLEVCVNCNDRLSAEALLKRMEVSGQVDVISYKFGSKK